MAKNLTKTPKQNNALHKVRKKVIWQAVVALQTIIITIALIFGMSAAWYTNVLQTSGLQFQAAAWGFSGYVNVSNDAIQASPGDSGIIGLSVANTGAEMVDVAVNVSKIQMVKEMQQRLFFYVDATAVRNEETVDRVYINTRDSYTYTLLSHSELTLSQAHSNDVLLKWQWVYDMLGYYFLGTVTQQIDPQTSEQVVLTNVEDYLRPVEYDLDTAIFTGGVLATANGLPVSEFLNQLSASDGYAGDITPSEYAGYYKVAVDEYGYGIWVYLCNWAEIQQATTYDSQLGKAAADALLTGEPTDSYIARLTVVGQLAQTVYTEVSNAAELETALNAGGAVQLQNNLQLTDALVVNGGEKTVLDLNGHTITGTNGSSVMNLSNGSNLIVMNGDIVANDLNKDVINVSGSSLTLSEVHISGQADDAINISDQGGTTNSCVRLFDSTIEVAGCAVYLRGNGSSEDGSTSVIVENCQLNSGYIGIMGNGTNSYWDTDVQIYRSTVTGLYAAVYQPQGDSLLRVTESTLSGLTGIVLKGGDLVITDSTIKGTGTGDAVSEPAYAPSGFTDTGDGVYLECSYDNVMNVTISGNKTDISSASGKAVRVFEEDSIYAQVSITGGTFSSDVSVFLAEGYVYDSSNGKVNAAEGAGNEE